MDMEKLWAVLAEAHDDKALTVVVDKALFGEAIDHIEWLEKGNSEWRNLAIIRSRQAEAARATARVAIDHLEAVLSKAKTANEQMTIDTAARNWLESIGMELQ